MDRTRKIRVGTLWTVLLLTLGACGGGETTVTVVQSAAPGEPGSPYPSQPSVSLSPREPLDELLNSDTGLLQAICNEAEHLVSVGWAPQLVPGLVSGESAGVALIDRHNLSKLEETGIDVTKSVEVAIDRCP